MIKALRPRCKCALLSCDGVRWSGLLAVTCVRYSRLPLHGYLLQQHDRMQLQ